MEQFTRYDELARASDFMEVVVPWKCRCDNCLGVLHEGEAIYFRRYNMGYEVETDYICMSCYRKEFD